ncbi:MULTISPECIES: phospholipase D-like domain-containing protein [unclassified Brevundimonas]|uniref:phospholipase D-like domain-containing protein n=1 Tax=unclassified Brevundimonas TaxID=2622653 RepID=UPI0025C6ED22|nr:MULTISPECIES: phospholipase D-like domain-containing protein [unclassified Brevundimonas]
MLRQTVYDQSLLVEGDAIWRTALANRLSPIMENDAYFEALSAALDKAEKSVLVLGWQFDPRTRLDPQSPDYERSEEIGERLKRMVKSRPDLDVRLLIWRSPILIAASQGFYPHKALKFFKKRMVRLELEGVGLLGACHHQKVVVIDDKVAFCGGGDISVDRWDEEGHYSGDPRRCMPSGLIPSPRHEWMCVVDGAAARLLGDLVRQRWERATGEVLPVVETDTDPWPEPVEPLFHDIRMGLSRTYPAVRGMEEVRENETLFLESIKSAKSLIYMENQYFTSPLIASAIAERLAEPDGPEVVLVSTGRSPSWFDGLTMDTARAEVLWRLEKADLHDRFYAFYPVTRRGDRIIVHAKMTIIDDKLMRIGSSNLNNRSMGVDTECDLSFEARTEQEMARIRQLRQHSIGHFIGVTTEDFAEAESLLGGIGKSIATFGKARMKVMGLRQPTGIERMFAEWQLGDPTSARDAWRPWRRRHLTRSTRPRSEGGTAAG